MTSSFTTDDNGSTLSILSSFNWSTNLIIEFKSLIISSSNLEFVEILDRANDFGLTTEVVHTALKVMKDHPDSSPLLCLQIAARDLEIHKRENDLVVNTLPVS